MFGMCIDKRVVGGVAVVAALLWWLAPGAVAAVLPLLAFAICPLSMLLMMKAMDRSGGAPAVAPDVASPEVVAAAGDSAVPSPAAPADRA